MRIRSTAIIISLLALTTPTISAFSSQIEQVKIANQRERNKNIENYFEESKALIDEGLDVKENNPKAIKILKMMNYVIEISPENANAYAYRARANNALLKNIEAISDAEKSIKIDSNNIDALFALGVAKVLLGDYKGALNPLRKAKKMKSYVTNRLYAI